MKPVYYTNLSLYLLTGRQQGFSHEPWNRGLPYRHCNWSPTVTAVRKILKLEAQDYFVRGALAAMLREGHLAPMDMARTGEYRIPVIPTPYEPTPMGAVDRSQWSYILNAGQFDKVHESLLISYIDDSTCAVAAGDYSGVHECTFDGSSLRVGDLEKLGVFATFVVSLWEVGETLTVVAPLVHYPYKQVADMLLAAPQSAELVYASGLSEEFYNATPGVEVVGVVAAAIARVAFTELLLISAGGPIFISDELRCPSSSLLLNGSQLQLNNFDLNLVEECEE